MSMLRRHWPWLLVLVVLLAFPFLFYDWSKGRHSGFVLTLMSEIGVMAIFALSYNMLMGQAGLLVVRPCRAARDGRLLRRACRASREGRLILAADRTGAAGGRAGGLFFGYVFGWLVTKQRATAFAMITMGLGELVSAAALMFMGFFGGEGGIPIDRVMDTSLVGVKYTSPWQVYCLVLVWAFIAAALMRLQTQTPLGSMANATRDNFERAQFVGYDPRMVRLYQFALSGFFAGIAGGLYVLIYEIVTFDTVSAAKSANALLAVYIGGAGGFFGPILGTIVVVLLQSGVSLLSNAWLLYVGVLFIVMVMYAPGGLIGLIFMHMPIWRAGRMRELALPYARAFPPALLVLLGFVLMVELASFTTIGAAQGKTFSIGGHRHRHHGANAMGGRARSTGARRAVASPRGARFSRALGRADGRRQDTERGAKLHRRKSAGGDVVSADAASVPAVELRDVRKNFGADRNHPWRQPRDPARRASRHHRPQRRRQDHAVQPDLGTFSDQLGLDHGQRPVDRQSGAAGDQPASACRAVSRSPRSSRA